MKTTQQQQSNYDQLLQVYLPIIHRAASSIHSEQCQSNALEDLLIAGFQGFKEAFSQCPSAGISESEKNFSQKIYNSMVRQLNGHHAASLQN